MNWRKKMYYNRTISEPLAQLMSPGGDLRWLFDFVKKYPDMDFLIGKNNSVECISVYRGLSRILSITQYADTTHIKIDAAKKFKALEPDIYGSKKIPCDFSELLNSLIFKIGSDPTFDRYYANRKEGFFQNELSRKLGIHGTKDDEFVIIDKEVVIGYLNDEEKTKIYRGLRNPYKALQGDISKGNAERYGKNLQKKSIGNELDFLALDRDGNILLIEYKHGGKKCNTSGIYLSPLQIGLYYDLFTKLNRDDLNKAVYEMLNQKQRIGLIHPDWKKPKKLAEIIPVLIISEFNYKSSAKKKFNEILKFVREKKGPKFLHNLKTYNYTTAKGLADW
jgi:hypothetical protein